MRSMSEHETEMRAAKHDFALTYDQPWPHPYFAAHLALDYMICERAKPVFQKVVARLQQRRTRSPIRIVDIGASYGVNAALLRSTLTLDDLYAAYTLPDGDLADQRMEEHQIFFSRQELRDDIEIIGLDPSRQALRYARKVGLIKSSVSVDLETEELTDADRDALRDADLIISTGCVGYATARTFRRVYEATAGSQPWVASFAMHPFAYDEIAAALAEFGLMTIERPDLRQRQRRFSTPHERDSILAIMGDLDMGDRLERATGHIYAAFHLSTPPDEMP